MAPMLPKEQQLSPMPCHSTTGSGRRASCAALLLECTGARARAHSASKRTLLRSMVLINAHQEHQ
jgi:hypothetical protein